MYDTALRKIKKLKFATFYFTTSILGTWGDSYAHCRKKYLYLLYEKAFIYITVIIYRNELFHRHARTDIFCLLFAITLFALFGGYNLGY